MNRIAAHDVPCFPISPLVLWARADVTDHKYGFNVLPSVGEGEMYYEISYNLTYPIIAIVVIMAFLIYYKKKKVSKEI